MCSGGSKLQPPGNVGMGLGEVATSCVLLRGRIKFDAVFLVLLALSSN